MPYKLSTNAFRNIKGERYVALQPRMVREIEAPIVATLRAKGVKVYLGKHDVFIRESDRETEETAR